ncbi:MAG: hypothetical protein ACI8T6_000215 [Candidatus Poseidoniaceae archaeon]|jgi:hypothetical protein|tara:strand:+ start:119 stop:517 length:399 start_codon:yes stop_codon:yes gene_type:complete
MKWPGVNEASITAVVTGGALMVSAILPHGGVNGLKLCPWYYLSGYPCPFCGMTRGFVAITHFDLQSAMEFNPGSPFIYGAFAYMMWASISALRKGESEMKPLSKILYISWLVPTLAVFTLMFYQRIVRVLLL